MIKLLLTTATLTAGCMISSANAQIQSMNPLPGDVFTYEFFDLTVADSGSIGAGQVWDFSGAVSQGDTYTKTFRTLTTQEQGDYPGANLAYTEDGDPTVYLMNASADSLADLGETSFTFSNPMVLYKYPMTSTTDFTDVSGVSGIPGFTFDGTIRTFSQGTGKLITPFGTYNNVIKIRRKGVVNYDLFGSQDQVLVDSYVWINADNRSELLLIESSDYVNDSEEDEMMAYFLKNGAFAGVKQISKDAFSLYPNPAQGTVYLKSAGETPVSYTIYSVAGAAIRTANYTASQGISTEGLQPGEYILQVEAASGMMSHVKFSKI